MRGLHGRPLLCVQGYGAYLTLMMLKSTDSIFRCACAVSPVTDWKLYGESSRTAPSQPVRAVQAASVPRACQSVFGCSERLCVC